MSLLFPQRHRGAVLLAVAFLLSIATASFAQSIDPNAPSPVRANSVTGRIAARDLGDSRLTDHYYSLTGTPGDLLITVNSKNLNGDIDVFTAGTLRPLLKITLYAELSAPVTKGIYLRKREDLVLRIEARSPNDEEGTYRLFFGGSFEPIIGGADIAEAETPATEAPRTPGTRRVNSVGARIEEPAPPVTEVAATPTPEPSPEPTPEAKPVESPSPSTEKAKTEKPATPRSTRGRRPAPGRPAPRTRDTTTTAEATQPKSVPDREPKREPEPAPEVGPRLVIETNDGTLINRAMSSVRRVTVENGQVVVVNRDGTINRILLANVVRMSISP